MPIPDEKARAWTRPEDYWPPRLRKRSGRAQIKRFGPVGTSEPEEKARPLLDLVPYAVLMLGLAVLAAAIIVLAWPGQLRSTQPQPVPAKEIGTAPKGWIDSEEPARP